MKHAPISHRSRFSSVIDIVANSGFALGPLIMGKIIDLYGILSVWKLSILFMIVGISIIVYLKFVENKLAKKD